jgi:hypothetical protein
VPTGDGDVTLSLTPAGEGGVRIAPYPFTTAPLAVTVATRAVERAAFETAPLEAYYDASREIETIQLRE